jgi:tRNA(Phe) wybutosine-synthesizing methylase Tyw3
MAGCESRMAFDQRKKHILVQLATVTKDRSPKGFPDYHVLPILDIINDFPDYVTTRCV